MYQGYTGILPLKDVIAIDTSVIRKTKPHLTIVLDIDAKTGLKRAAGKGRKDRMESKSLTFHKRVRGGYRDLARKNKRRIKLIKVREAIAETQGIVRSEVFDVIQRYSRT